MRLRRNVEPGDDLVGENEIRPQHHGPRDADALTLSAGKLERIPFDRIPLQSDAIKNALHQCERSRVVLRQAMQQDRLGEDAADRVPRIKRGTLGPERSSACDGATVGALFRQAR